MNHSNFNVNIYRGILSQNDSQNIYKAAETKRKCTVQVFKGACESMGNTSACELLGHKLDDYTRTIYKDGKNIYDSLLKQTFPNLVSDRQLKIPQTLPKLDLNLYLKDLGYSSGDKAYCTQCEQISPAELQQFGNVFRPKNEQIVLKVQKNSTKNSLDCRFNHLDKLQNFEQNYVKRVDFPTTSKKQEKLSPFVTARDELDNQSYKFSQGGVPLQADENVPPRKKLGLKRTVRSKFVSPLLSRSERSEEIDQKVNESPLVDKRLKHIEPKMVELIMGEIMDQSPNIGWNDIAGLEFAKSAIQEAVVWPMLRPDIFTGLRRPPKGILLFGPPGTGKTLIGKCVASQSKSTFFSISASSLTSKWIGNGEKMVRALFAVARVHQPAVIFIDEVDSLLTQRSDTEHECSRRIKTEFLVQLDGVTTDSEERLLVIGATNRPQELDEAARRRFVKRLHIPLPEHQARYELITKLMLNERHLLTEEHFTEIASLSDGYSGADIKNLCSEASLGPIRSIDFNKIENIQASEVRPLTIEDFKKSLQRVRPSVSQNDLVHYVQWDKTYGSGSGL